MPRFERSRRTRFRAADVATSLCITFLTGTLIWAAAGRTRAIGGARLCVENHYDVTRAVAVYASDYDDVLPPIRSHAEAMRVLVPYVKRRAEAFYCPATDGTPYQFNGSLTHVPVTRIASIPNTPVVGDAIPHYDGRSVIGYLDGHVTLGGVDQESAQRRTLAGAYRLVAALNMYAQDYDERLPVFANDTEAKNALMLYLRLGRLPDERPFISAESGQYFRFNTSLSGRSLNDFAVPEFVEAVSDPAPYAPGRFTVAYLDGYVKRGGVEIYDPETEGLTRLRRLGIAVLQYTDDNFGLLPPLRNYNQFRTAVSPYLPGPRPLRRPGDNGPWTLNTDLHGQRTWFLFPPSRIWVARDSRRFRDGTVAVLYLDGHVERTVRP